MLASILDRMVDHRRLTQPDVLEDILERSLVECDQPESWVFHKTPPWVHVQSKTQVLPEQGWKIHVSAKPAPAPEILAICLPILLRAKVSFKFIMNLRLLYLLNSSHAPRSASGKFITIYPHDINVFRQLVAECSEATAAFKGPMILSDKFLQPGGLIHYRYGAFKPLISYDLNGAVVYSLRNPEGELVTDTRSVSTRQPQWAEDPFEAVSPVTRPSTSAPPAAVRLHDRYTVTNAIRHANKGGVYLAIDETTGRQVVIKEARPNVATDRFDRDATNRLQREAENLRILASRGLTPQPIELFWESEHLFLVLEWLPGTTLREHILEFKKRKPTRLPRRTLLSLSYRLVKLLERCHSSNLIIRDFSPNNVMLTPSGRLFLIDLEMACAPGEDTPIGLGEGTPGYASPQQIAERPPTFEDDYFSLGACLFFLATLRDPVFPNDEPKNRSLVSRAQRYLELFFREHDLPFEFTYPILANLEESPDDRWSLDRVLLQLSRRNQPSLSDHFLPDRPPLSEQTAFCKARECASATVREIMSSFDFVNNSFPFLPTCVGENSHPCNVQHGTAGVGMSLIAYARATGEDRCYEALRGLCDWTIRYIERHPEAPPGLYFGTAGTSWFMLEAAELLGSREYRAAAISIASRLPLSTPLFDVTHGAAGIGLTFLHFFHRTGDSEFLRRTLALAEQLSSAYQSDCVTGGIIWNRTSSAADVRDTFYGYAHGVAGIAYLFLCLYLITGTEEYLSIARRSATTLYTAATQKGRFLYWPHGPSRPSLWPHWCNGNSGVGTFLIRLAMVTRDLSAFRVSLLGARAILRERWTSGVSQCHGLAGNGEYLLDLFRFTGEREFFVAALYLAELIDLHKINRPNGLTYPDDTGFPTGVDFSTGSAGVAVFLSRLLSNTPRLFMLDYLLPAGSALPPISKLGRSSYAPTFGSLSY